MRKIDWNEALSPDDVAWLRQAGFMSEEQIERHQSQHKAEVPEVEIPEDTVTRDGLSADRVRERVVTGDGPLEVDPTGGSGDEDEIDDDYDSWKVGELEAEVTARDGMPDTSRIVIEATGANGKVLKPDLIAALRVWDKKNPDALKD
jgi:hypothetical protein